MIAACEERYRQIYKQEDENIQIDFPKHYPTSALIGYVDVVDVLHLIIPLLLCLEDGHSPPQSQIRL